jgi:hypothetical protein
VGGDGRGRLGGAGDRAVGGGAADGEARAPLEPLHQRAAVDGLELALEAVDGLAIVLTLRFVGP